jgi:ankyrin repeat protein
VDIDDTIEDLMRFQKRDLLRERYDYDKTSLETHAKWAHYAERSSLTCVHLLTAAGKVEAIKNLLRLVPQDSEDEIRELEDFLTYPVYYDIGKQYDEQPSKRLVSALHFAASVGSVELIDIFMKRGCFNADETYGEEFYRNSPLAMAVECDKVYAFRKLVELSSLFNSSSMLELVGKFLRIASATGSRDVVKELLRLAKKDNHINTLKFQDLIQACKLHATSRGFKQVENLLGDALNPDYGLRDALREAVRVGKKDTVEELVGKGAQVDEVPLMECVINEKSELLPSLLPRASKVPEEFWMGVAAAKEDFAKLAFDNYERTRSDDEKLDFTNNQLSPIHVAAAQDRVEMVTSFCNLGASLHNVDERGNLILHVAAKHDAVNVLKEKLQFFDVNTLNADGDTILLVACKHSRQKTVELLTDTPGVNWKVKNTFGDTPLHVAMKQLFVTGKAVKRRRDRDNVEVTMATREEKVQTIALVAAKCADISALDEVDSEGNTALSLLVQAGREQLFHLFSKADPTVLNAKRKCAMDYAMAAFEERRDLVRKLLEIFPAKGAAHLAMAYKHCGRPPLHHFAMSRDLSNVRLLTQHGADVTELNEEGCPIFHALIKLSVQDDNYAGEYIAMAQAVMEALTEFRIKRQQDICCYMSGEYSVSNSNGVEGYESESYGKSLDSSLTALLVKKNNDFDNDYLGLEGNKFISNKQLSRMISNEFFLFILLEF